MTSRGRTAPPPSQPASILKPSRTQTRPSKSQANRTPSGKESRPKKTRQDSRPDQTTAASRRTLQTRRDGTVATRRRDGRSGGGEDKLKTDNVWNKFLDDKDVVRAPTAESEETHVTSYVTGDSEDLSDSDDSEYTDSEDSAEGEEEDEIDDSDDDRTIYSNYYLDQEYYESESPPGPRAEIQEGTEYEACSCFPNRTDKNKGSMLYDKIKCKHTGLIGHTQPGVFKFNPYWNENMEIPKKTRKRDMSYPKTTFVFGYPKPQFELASESEEDGSDVSDDSDGYRERTTGRGRTRGTKDSGSTYDSDDTGDSYDSYDDYSDSTDESESDEDEDENQDYIPFQLPKIGIPKTPSLPPSSQSFRSRYSEYSDVPDSLPELPGSRQLTAVQTANSRRIGTTQRTQRTRQETRKSTRAGKPPRTAKTSKSTRKSARFSDSEDSRSTRSRSKRRTASRQSLPKGPVISTTRTFQGKYYDPETKQVMLFDIGTQPGKRLPVGNIEPLYKPATVQPESAQDKSPAGRDPETGSKPGSQDNTLEEPRQPAAGKLKAAVLGNLFIRSMLKNKKD